MNKEFQIENPYLQKLEQIQTTKELLEFKTWLINERKKQMELYLKTHDRPIEMAQTEDVLSIVTERIKQLTVAGKMVFDKIDINIEEVEPEHL